MKKLRATLAAAGLVAASPAVAEPAPAGRYQCFSFINGSLVRVLTPFTIRGSAYRADDNTSGTVAFDAAAGTITFSGGSLNGETAVYENAKIHFGRRKSVNCEPAN